MFKYFTIAPLWCHLLTQQRLAKQLCSTKWFQNPTHMCYLPALFLLAVSVQTLTWGRPCFPQRKAPVGPGLNCRPWIMDDGDQASIVANNLLHWGLLALHSGSRCQGICLQIQWCWGAVSLNETGSTMPPSPAYGASFHVWYIFTFCETFVSDDTKIEYHGSSVVYDCWLL